MSRTGINTGDYQGTDLYELPQGPGNIVLDPNAWMELVESIPVETGRRLAADMKAEQRRSALAASMQSERDKRARYNVDIAYVCGLSADSLQKRTLVELATGLSQLSVAFRNELLPKKKSKSPLADAALPVDAVASAMLQFDSVFNLVKKSMNKASSVFAGAAGGADWDWGDGFDSWKTSMVENAIANKLEDLFGTTCISSYFDFMDKAKVLKDSWYGVDGTRGGLFYLQMSLGLFDSALTSANSLLDVNRQPRSLPKSSASFRNLNDKLGAMRKGTKVSAVLALELQIRKSISTRIYNKKSYQDGAWPVDIKTCEDWNYLRYLLAKLDSYFYWSYHGAEYLKLTGEHVERNINKFVDVVTSGVSFSNAVLQSIANLANIKVTEVSGSPSSMRSKLKATSSDFGSRTSFARNFAEYQIKTNLAFWYGIPQKEEFFAAMAGVPKSNWSLRNRDTNLYNFGLFLFDNVTNILKSFEGIINNYDMVTASSSDASSLSAKARQMMTEGSNGMAKVNDSMGAINRQLAGYSGLATYTGINSLGTLIECTCDGHPLPASRFSSVQRALIAKYYNCTTSAIPKGAMPSMRMANR